MEHDIQIVEVGPRDGLQNENNKLSVKTRYQFVQKLIETGLKRIEIGAFVSPKWVPQMADTEQLVGQLLEAQQQGRLAQDVRFSVLVPNQKGMEYAVHSGIGEVAIFGACSETFSKKNINCSVEESFKRFADVVDMARSHGLRVRGYLSTAFGCPYEGHVSMHRVVDLTKRMVELGVYEVSIGDTIGVATPKQVSELGGELVKTVGAGQLAMHFHDTRGTALANVLTSIHLGLRVFDSSLGGLGGCPYARGASGNLATEDLVYMLHGMGLDTSVDLEKAIALKKWMESEINRFLPSRVGQAGLPLEGTI